MTTTPGSITERQRDYLRSLLDDRDLFASPKWSATYGSVDAAEYDAALHRMKTIQVPDLSKAAASAWIAELVKLPKKARDSIAPSGTAGPWKVQRHEYAEDGEQYKHLAGQTFLWMQYTGGPGVPRGSYAIERSSLRFPGAFKNDLLFFSVWISDDGERWTVRMYASDERVKISRSLQYDVLDAIGQAPAEAAARYGHEIGKCGICGKKLTNDVSRERGIGPICAERWGW